MKKTLCALLALLMVLSLAACGGNSTKPAGDGSYYIGSEVGQKKLENAFNPLNPTNVYSNTTFNEQMLYGDFRLENLEKNLEKRREKFVEEAAFEEITYSETYGTQTAEENLVTVNLTSLPVEVSLGHGSNNYARKLRGEHEWATLRLVNERGYPQEVLCTYTVSGNTISFAPLAGYEEVHDENFKVLKIAYTVGTQTLDYTFELAGTKLTLSRNGQKVTLKTKDFSDNGFSSKNFGGYLASGSPAAAGMENFSATLSKDLSTVYMYDLAGNFYSYGLQNAAVKFNEEGQISFYWETKDENDNVIEHLHHFVYLPGNGYCMTLLDADNVYYYTETYLSREAASLGEGMSAEELALLNGLSDSELEAIAKKKANLLEDLAAAYQDAGLNVSVNLTTGEIALDSTVLFDVNEYAISADGKAFLQKFTQIYTDTVYSEEYADFVSRIVVEGHTDTNGGYDMNLELSKNRANSVKDYCVSEECGVNSAYAADFAGSLEAVGYSYDKPVYGTDGKVDMDASRRVSFRFIVALGE